MQLKTKISRCVANIYDLKSVYTRLEFPDNHGAHAYIAIIDVEVSVFFVTFSCSVDLRSAYYFASGNDAMLGTDNEKFPERCTECRQRNSRLFGKCRVSPYTHRTCSNVATMFLQASVECASNCASEIVRTASRRF